MTFFSFLAASCHRADQLTVRRVSDGDTVVLSDGAKVRYIGIDTPEKERPYYDEARRFNEKLVLGKAVRLEYDIEKTDRYGRTLAYVYLKDGTFVNAEMIRQGYANIYTFPPNLKYTELFLSFQKEARQANRGLWGVKVALSSYYVFSARGRAFHRPDCEFAGKISKKNRIQLAGREKAFDRGLSPCRKCNP
ncbi:MAG: thermonuclease family protein [Elusimicrobia bacterium]|nr:thermonuclease family protein [Elusimicrobiota bacterium]